MPRSLSCRLLSLCLALLVLATSVGLTSERHRCRISGRSTVVLSLPGLGAGRAEEAGSRQPGQPNQPSSPTKPCGKRRSGCCDISHAHYKLHTQTPAAGLAKWLPALPVALLPALLPAPTWAGRVGEEPLPLAISWRGAADSSPPGLARAGRVLLAFEGKLVV